MRRPTVCKREIIFLCPHSCPRIWFHETGSVIPSRVSLLILYTQAKPGACSRYSSRFPRRRPYIYIANRHRISPGFIRSRNGVPMTFTAESRRRRTSSRHVLPVTTGVFFPDVLRPSFVDSLDRHNTRDRSRLCTKFVLMAYANIMYVTLFRRLFSSGLLFVHETRLELGCMSAALLV